VKAEEDKSRDGVAGQSPPRLALRPAEAAESLGCSRDFFDRHIAPELRWIRRGRLKFVAVAEIEDWLSRSAARTQWRRSQRLSASVRVTETPWKGIAN
jgi:hypothetical protein